MKNIEKGVTRMKLEIKTNVKGLEELKGLLESGHKQVVELQETLDKISQSEIEIDFEPIPREVRHEK